MKLGSVEAIWTDRRHGDLGPARQPADQGEVERRRRRVVDLPWSWLKQVHGRRVAVVEAPGARAGEEGDGLVSSTEGVCLAVFTADCVPLALGSPEGVMGAVHVGWRGLVAGVVDAGASAMRSLGATNVYAALGPCVHPECYEFSPSDLATVEALFGGAVRSVTRSGRPALDMPSAVAVALERSGAELVAVDPVCTACSSCHFSYRARRDAARQALVVHRA